MMIPPAARGEELCLLRAVALFSSLSKRKRGKIGDGSSSRRLQRSCGRLQAHASNPQRNYCSICGKTTNSNIYRIHGVATRRQLSRICPATSSMKPHFQSHGLLILFQFPYPFQERPKCLLSVCCRLLNQ